MLAATFAYLSYIQASPLNDPGSNDVTHSYLSMMQKNLMKTRSNFSWEPVHVQGGITWVQKRAGYALEDYPRTFALICEEFQEDYQSLYSHQLLHNVEMLISTFRSIGHPIFWTLFYLVQKVFVIHLLNFVFFQEKNHRRKIFPKTH